MLHCIDRLSGNVKSEIILIALKWTVTQKNAENPVYV